ncbi:hypothetical protein H6501_03160 [Candidatus Woesearchaeota archaeon]|nr:hypothetical protein [Candidatus Woesearchaeota archaeon]
MFLDISSQFSENSYSSPSLVAMLSQRLDEKQRQTHKRNMRIGRTLVDILPDFYAQRAKELGSELSYPWLSRGEKICFRNVASNPETFPLSFCDLGVIVPRAQEIAEVYTSLVRDSALHPKIKILRFLDSSSAALKQANQIVAGSSLDLSFEQQTFEAMSFSCSYGEVPECRYKKTLEGDFVLVPELVTVQRRILALLGRTLNNFDSPAEVLSQIFYKNLSPTDVGIVEARVKAVSLDEYSGALAAYKAYVHEVLGISQTHTKQGQSVFLEEDGSSLYANVSLEEDLQLSAKQMLLFACKESFLRKGTKIRFFRNQAINPQDFASDLLPHNLEVFHYDSCDPDGIFYIRSVTPPTVYGTSCSIKMDNNLFL